MQMPKSKPFSGGRNLDEKNDVLQNLGMHGELKAVFQTAHREIFIFSAQ